MKRLFRRCGHAPGALSPEDQAAVDAFRAMLDALRDPEPWTPDAARTSPSGSAPSWSAPAPDRVTTTGPVMQRKSGCLSGDP
ncbi:hypothetical protein [Streptomyces mirabilis]|uniref:hypothetical protein n=1 Tax=Streptomyces mirabilis TaxID=68239 RepID=UPI003653C93A